LTALIAIVVILCIAYGAMVVIFWIGIVKLKKEKDTVSVEKIHISIVVAFRNEEHNLSALLSSIENLNYPRNLYEVILVNDNSSDNWETLTGDWEKRMPNLRVLSLNTEKGKKHALALGIENASFNHIVTTDGDCKIHTDWLVTISTEFSTSNSSVVIGPVLLNPSGNAFELFQTLEHSSLTAATLGGCKMGIPFMASSANLAFNKKELGFNLSMLNTNTPSGDDVFLLHSAIEKGLKVSCYLNPCGTVETKPVDSIKAFLNQRARWASKSKHYKNAAAINVALIVFGFNALLLVLLGCLLFSDLNPIWLAIPFGTKLAVDFLLLNSYLGTIARRKMLLVFIPLQMIYPFYIAAAFFISITKTIKWK
jgi:poly-beta-1,6-N-acetyl-D-glucosamine synthase